MTINVYLRCAKNEKGLTNEERTNSTGGKYVHTEWNGVRVNIDNTGHVYFSARTLEDSLGIFPLGSTDEVTVRDTFTARTRREIGIYNLNTEELDKGSYAFAKLDFHQAANQYEIEMRADSLFSARILYYQIRSGKVRPTESWDAEQVDTETTTDES